MELSSVEFVYVSQGSKSIFISFEECQNMIGEKAVNN